MLVSQVQSQRLVLPSVPWFLSRASYTGKRAVSVRGTQKCPGSIHFLNAHKSIDLDSLFLASFHDKTKSLRSIQTKYWSTILTPPPGRGGGLDLKEAGTQDSNLPMKDVVHFPIVLIQINAKLEKNIHTPSR